MINFMEQEQENHNSVQPKSKKGLKGNNMIISVKENWVDYI